MLKLNAVRLGLGRPLQQPPSLSSFSISASPASASALRFASGGSGEEMDDSKKHNDPKSKTVDTADTMASSFGEGYATRSDDDGFGGVYGRNDKADEDTNVHEVDHSQGSEVKEKEKARNQEKLANV